MSEQHGSEAFTIQRPTSYDLKAWRAYWKKQGQPWRTQPEIDEERQKYLDERRKINPATEDSYPFEDVEPKLSRADIEWLLATHENGRGPIDWKEESQREREGLDLRGANLQGLHLIGLPLARMRGGRDYMVYPLFELRKEPVVQLEGAILDSAHLEGAILGSANLEGASLGAVHLERADLNAANLKRTRLFSAHLERATLVETHLEGAGLQGAHLEGADLRGTHLEGANLFRCYFDSETALVRVSVNNKEFGPASLADIHWNDINLTLVDWSALSILGDEQEWQQSKGSRPKDKKERLYVDQYPTRVYLQLAVMLRNQGLNDDAARFTYRGQLLQRKVYWYQQKFGQYFFSLFLDLLAGYGYKPWRSFVAYLIVILGLATIYFLIGQSVGPPLSPVGSLVFSMTSFHGRGFFPGGIKLDDPLTILAAIEAFVGLLIEVTFIATLTQRLFGK